MNNEREAEAARTLQHSHEFNFDSARNERNTRWVVILTAAMMTGEIIGGWVFHSMALMADGFHMGSHTFALGITLLAYWYARRNARNPEFSFGTGKVYDLGGYTSAILLLVVALLMAAGSVERFLNPVEIQFNEAIAVACVGLGVNLASAWILRDRHGHPGEAAEHGHDHAHRDHNIKSAYLHVLADALTSVLAISALLLGKLFGWVWMDPVMGVVGSVVITRWSIGLMKDTSGVLLDKQPDSSLLRQVRERLEADPGTRLADLHVWEVAPGRFALIASIQAASPRPAGEYKQMLADCEVLDHVTIEVNPP